MFPTVKFIRHFCTWFEYCLIFCWLCCSLFSFFGSLSFLLGSLEPATKSKGKNLEWQSPRNKQSPMVLDINVSCVVHRQQLRLEPILIFVVFLSFIVFIWSSYVRCYTHCTVTLVQCFKTPHDQMCAQLLLFSLIKDFLRELNQIMI